MLKYCKHEKRQKIAYNGKNATKKSLKKSRKANVYAASERFLVLKFFHVIKNITIFLKSLILCGFAGLEIFSTISTISTIRQPAPALSGRG